MENTHIDVKVLRVHTAFSQTFTGLDPLFSEKKKLKQTNLEDLQEVLICGFYQWSGMLCL